MPSKRLFIFILLLYRGSHAQDLFLSGISTNYLQTGRINKNWNYNIHFLSVYNTSEKRIAEKNFPSGHAHFISHLIANRKINSNFNIGFGYAFGRHDIFGLRENEHRFLSQIAYNQKLKKLTINHRTRFEFRKPKNLSTNISSNASILRYQLGLNYPFYNPKESKKGFYAHASNEMFFYLKGATNGPVSSKNGLLWSENWSNTGLGFSTGRNRVELGYGFQRLIRNKKQDLRCFHLLQISYFANINWDDLQYWWHY